MVSLGTENIYSLRDWVLDNAVTKAGADPLKIAYLIYLNVLPDTALDFNEIGLSHYQKCSIFGFGVADLDVSSDEYSRLLGQAPQIDGTPMPWVADIWGVLGIKFAIDALNDETVSSQFYDWIKRFLPDRIKSGRLDKYELDIANYINSEKVDTFSSASIALYLHYKNILPITVTEHKDQLAERFMEDFRKLVDAELPSIMLATYSYVFDRLNEDVSNVPPNNWCLEDILKFLENIPAGLKRWTWEEKPRTRNGTARKWNIDSEYHVQNLLYVLLAPIFDGISDEENLESVGQKHPRVDLYLPTVDILIEVKYRKDNKKSFAELIGEIAEDVTLYRSDSRFTDSKLICFLWDNTRSTQEHVKFKEGVLKMNGIQGCVVINSPSSLE